MNTSQVSFIVVDVIKERASDIEIAQLCGDLTTNYHSQMVAANTEHTLDWPSGGITEPVKVKVGDVDFLAEYDSTAEAIKILGSCGSADWDDFSVSGGILFFSHNGFSFEVWFNLFSGFLLKITIKPGNNTTIDAFS